MKVNAVKVVREPRLLPYILKKSEVAALTRRSERTVDEWCRSGTWKRGVQFTVPHRRRVFLRDGVLPDFDSLRDIFGLFRRRNVERSRVFPCDMAQKTCDMDMDIMVVLLG